MRVGQMNVPFLLQSERLVPDGEGGKVRQWSTIANLWGSIEDYQDQEVTQSFSEPSHIIMARNRMDVEVCNLHRLVYKDRTYQVRSVRFPSPKRIWMRIYVSETTYLN